MSHQPNWQEYGNPVAQGGKTATEVHDGIYGPYQCQAPEPTSSNAEPKHTPKPFSGNGSTPK